MDGPEVSNGEQDRTARGGGEAAAESDARAEAEAELRAGTSASGMRIPADLPLLPVMEPAFNLREIAKQMLLLEAHLAVPRQRCADCIRKHYATIEALAEEGASLDAGRGGLHEEIFARAAEFARHWQARLYGEGIGDPARSSALDPATMRAAAAALRKVRKPILRISGDSFFDQRRYVLAHQLAAQLAGEQGEGGEGE